MRTNKKSLSVRLSAALLALIMVMTLVPTALAVTGCPVNNNGEHMVERWEHYVKADCHTNGLDRGVCRLCKQTVYEETDPDLSNHDAIYTDEGNGFHSAVCTYHPATRIPLEEHEINNSGICSKCGAVDYSEVSMNLPENLVIPVALNSTDAKVSVGEVRLILGKSANITDDYNISYKWYYNNISVADTAEYVLPDSVTGREGTYYYVLHVNATPKNPLRKPIGGSCTVTVNVEDLITASAIISQDEPSLYLGDPDYWSGESVSAQIYAAVQDVCPYDEEPDYVMFHTLPDSTVGSLGVTVLSTRYYFESSNHKSSLDDLKFTVATGTNATTGDYTVGFTAYDTDGNGYAGVLTITVQQYAGDMDVVLATSKSVPVTLDPDDFEEFWAKTYSNGVLDSIRFKELPRSTEGTLKLDYVSASSSGISLSTRSNLYVDPGSKQYGIDAVTFIPGVRQVDYITLDFEATGTKNNGRAGSLSGTLYIFIHDGSSADITMKTAAGGVTLDPVEFQKAYQSATGGTGASFYIRLLEVPVKGELYVNRTVSRPGTLLTSKTIGNYFFSYSDSKGESISSVTYVPASGTLSESIRYVACSSQGKPLYTGKITFTAAASTPTTPTTPTTTNGLVLDVNCPATGVQLSSSSFETLPGTTAPKLTTVVFAQVPTTSGTFYYGRTSTSPGTMIYLNNTSFSTVTVNPPAGALRMDNLTFVPAAGFTGVVSVAFTATDASNNRYTGTMRINVGGTATDPNTPTTPPTNDLPKKTFPDVSSGWWSYPYITELTTTGVLSGYEDGTFRPGNAVNLGEALKMIMIAANPAEYTDLQPTTKHWASGYLERAVQDGLLAAGQEAKLDKNVSRYTIAEIAVKALKLSPVENATVSPFTDMALTHPSAKYVLPLYQRSIITGDDNKFLGVNAITREEFAAVVWRIQCYVQTGVVGTPSVT